MHLKYLKFQFSFLAMILHWWVRTWTKHLETYLYLHMIPTMFPPSPRKRNKPVFFPVQSLNWTNSLVPPKGKGRFGKIALHTKHICIACGLSHSARLQFSIGHNRLDLMMSGYLRLKSSFDRNQDGINSFRIYRGGPSSVWVHQESIWGISSLRLRWSNNGRRFVEIAETPRDYAFCKGLCKGPPRIF